MSKQRKPSKATTQISPDVRAQVMRDMLIWDLLTGAATVTYKNGSSLPEPPPIGKAIAEAHARSEQAEEAASVVIAKSMKR